MTREELEIELNDFLDYPYNPQIRRALELGIRYGFEKAREEKILGYDPDGFRLITEYESAEQVIEELNNDAQKAS